jgi:hypothetical protein
MIHHMTKKVGIFVRFSFSTSLTQDLLKFLGTSRNIYIDIVTGTNQFTEEAEEALKSAFDSKSGF